MCSSDLTGCGKKEAPLDEEQKGEAEVSAKEAAEISEEVPLIDRELFFSDPEYAGAQISREHPQFLDRYHSLGELA